MVGTLATWDFRARDLLQSCFLPLGCNAFMIFKDTPNPKPSAAFALSQAGLPCKELRLRQATCCSDTASPHREASDT